MKTTKWKKVMPRPSEICYLAGKWDIWCGEVGETRVRGTPCWRVQRQALAPGHWLPIIRQWINSKRGKEWSWSPRRCRRRRSRSPGFRFCHFLLRNLRKTNFCFFFFFFWVVDPKNSKRVKKTEITWFVGFYKGLATRASESELRPARSITL